jgi:hypothetical protein
LVFFAYQNLAGGVAGVHMGQRPFWSNPWGFSEIGYAGVFAWVFPFVILVGRSAKRNLDALRPSLNPSTAGPGWLGPASTRYFRIAGMIGIGVTLVLSPGYISTIAPQQRPEAWGAWVVWMVVRDIVLAWLCWRAWAVALSVAIHFYRLGDRNAVARLLNPHTLSPFVHQGFRLSLLFCIGIAIGSPAFGLIPVPQAKLFSGLAPAILVALLFAALLLCLPCAGAYRAIAREKSVELERVRTEIERQRGMALSADHESKVTAAGQLPGLLAYEARVESVREWPINVFGVLRFLLYVAIPVGSWVASALVERLVTGALE